MSATISATGARGFLLWLKQQQPGIYQMVAPKLPALVPEIFTQTEQKLGELRIRRAQLRDIYRSGVAHRTGHALGKLGYYCTDFFCNTAATASGGGSGVTVNYTAQLSAPISYTAVSPINYNITTNYASSLSSTSGDLTGVCPSTPTLASDTSSGGGIASDVASSANTGSMGAGSASQLASAIQAVSGAVLTAGEVGLLGKAIQTQLLNAQQGLAPKTISTAALGIPTVAAKTSLSSLLSSPTDLFMIAAAGLAVYLLLGTSKVKS